MRASVYRFVSFCCLAVFSTASFSDALDDARDKIASDLSVMNRHGQDKLMASYARMLQEDNSEGNTFKGETYDYRTSTVKTYAYGSSDMTSDYDPEALSKSLLKRMSLLCSLPHIRVMRSLGFSQRAILVDKKTGDDFTWVEIAPGSDCAKPYKWRQKAIDEMVSKSISSKDYKSKCIADAVQRGFRSGDDYIHPDNVRRMSFNPETSSERSLWIEPIVLNLPSGPKLRNLILIEEHCTPKWWEIWK